MRKVLIGVFALAAVGGAYYLGTKSNVPSPPAPAAEKVEVSQIVDNLIVPTGLKMPEKLPEMKIDDAEKVLKGEVKVPLDLLRTEPPPIQPDLVIPMLK